MTTTTPAGKRLLLVEDSEDTRDTLAFVLRREGYAVETADNGRAALEQVRSAPPDLILLDMLLPVVDGWQVLRQVQADQQLAGLPIVIVTGTILTREWAEQSGCAGFVGKPVDHGALLEEVRRCLSAA